MSETAIEVKNISRTFGDFTAVDKISFNVPKASSIGFIGTNGAGKTTTMRMLATLESPDSGTIFIDGLNATQFPEKVRKRIGWMPDNFGVYPNTLVWEYIDFFARAYGLTGKSKKLRIEHVMEFTGLGSLRDKFTEALSKGMKQRLCLGRMLLSNPDIIIMDEPAAGLDPEARVHLQQLIRSLNKDGRTIFISSHILSELEDVCGSFIFIHQGIIRFQGTLGELKRLNSPKLEYRIKCISDHMEKLAQWIQINPDIKISERLLDGFLVEIGLEEPETTHTILERMIRDGLGIYEFALCSSRLEEIFVKLVRENDT